MGGVSRGVEHSEPQTYSAYANQDALLWLTTRYFAALAGRPVALHAVDQI